VAAAPASSVGIASSLQSVAVKGFLDTRLWLMNSLRRPVGGSRRSAHDAAARAT
jgi:hypothetical protein